MTSLIVPTNRGYYCPPGDFYIDPLRSVPRAVVSHAHSDHCRPGSGHYTVSATGVAVSRQRLGSDAPIHPLGWGEVRTFNGVEVSLHPAGHLLGSAQVRIEWQGEVWVYSGDYKREKDPSCETFEVIPCDTFMTECTFGLPVYRWPDPEGVFESIHQWWRENQASGRTSVLFAYALGKAQRILASIDPSIGPIGVHGAVAPFLEHYAAAGRNLAPATKITAANKKEFAACGLIITPASAAGTHWIRGFGDISTATASGWTVVRGNRRRQAVDRGFPLSDHADWPGLLRTIAATGARRVIPIHGFTEPFGRYLIESGLAEVPDGWGIERPVVEE